MTVKWQSVNLFVGPRFCNLNRLYYAEYTRIGGHFWLLNSQKLRPGRTSYTTIDSGQLPIPPRSVCVCVRWTVS